MAHAIVDCSAHSARILRKRAGHWRAVGATFADVPLHRGSTDHRRCHVPEQRGRHAQRAGVRARTWPASDDLGLAEHVREIKKTVLSSGRAVIRVVESGWRSAAYERVERDFLRSTHLRRGRSAALPRIIWEPMKCGKALPSESTRHAPRETVRRCFGCSPGVVAAGLRAAPQAVLRRTKAFRRAIRRSRQMVLGVVASYSMEANAEAKHRPRPSRSTSLGGWSAAGRC